jgi:hypothetical protein
VGTKAVIWLIQWPVVMLTTQRAASGEVQTAWSCTFISPHSFMVCPETTLSFTVPFVLCSISREMVGWLRKKSQNWKCYKFSKDDIADVEMVKIVYAWYGRFRNVGNSLRTISQMLKWWKFSREGIADVEMVEILYGRYSTCWNGWNSVRTISHILKWWKFCRDVIDGELSLGMVSEMLKCWKFSTDDIEEFKVLNISFTCIIKVDSAVSSDGRLPNNLRAVASGFY